MTTKHRVQEFKFVWSDAWLSRLIGYDGTLKIESDGLYILFWIDSEPYKFDLTDKEDEFYQMLDDCNIKEWNDYIYHTDLLYLDGYRWEIKLNLDGEMISCEGSNGYPKEFYNLIRFFHESGVPRAEFYSNKSLKEDIKHTIKSKTGDYSWLEKYANDIRNVVK